MSAIIAKQLQRKDEYTQSRLIALADDAGWQAFEARLGQILEEDRTRLERVEIGTMQHLQGRVEMVRQVLALRQRMVEEP